MHFVHKARRLDLEPHHARREGAIDCDRYCNESEPLQLSYRTHLDERRIVALESRCNDKHSRSAGQDRRRELRDVTLLRL